MTYSMTVSQARAACYARHATSLVGCVILGIVLLLAAGIVDYSQFTGQTFLLCTALSLTYVALTFAALRAVEAVDHAPYYMRGRDVVDPLVNLAAWAFWLFGPAFVVFWLGSRIGLSANSGWPTVDACNQAGTTSVTSAFVSVVFSFAVAGAYVLTDYFNERTMMRANVWR